jgi:phosphoribosyl 1,2-cyclic phosphodiesterase
MDSPILVTFWGVRGSIASPGKHTVIFGGNTSCVSVETQDHIVILDAGSGIRELGQHLVKKAGAKVSHGSLLLSHLHWDHIQGLPFFTPARNQNNRFTIYGEGKCQQSLARLLGGQMQSPYFPVHMETIFQARTSFREVETRRAIALHSDIVVIPFRLTHPDGALGYLLHIGDRRIAYVTDHEHHLCQLSPEVLAMTSGVDLLIHDAQYSRTQIITEKRGWGHSAWEDVVALALEADVGQLVLFHHDPEATDEILQERQFMAQAQFPHTIVAREGLKIPLRREKRARSEVSWGDRNATAVG